VDVVVESDAHNVGFSAAWLARAYDVRADLQTGALKLQQRRTRNTASDAAAGAMPHRERTRARRCPHRRRRSINPGANRRLTVGGISVGVLEEDLSAPRSGRSFIVPWKTRLVRAIVSAYR
jgi:hypothetical protein